MTIDKPVPQKQEENAPLVTNDSLNTPVTTAAFSTVNQQSTLPPQVELQETQQNGEQIPLQTPQNPQQVVQFQQGGEPQGEQQVLYVQRQIIHQPVYINTYEQIKVESKQAIQESQVKCCGCCNLRLGLLIYWGIEIALKLGCMILFREFVGGIIGLLIPGLAFYGAYNYKPCYVSVWFGFYCVGMVFFTILSVILIVFGFMNFLHYGWLLILVIALIYAIAVYLGFCVFKFIQIVKNVYRRHQQDCCLC